MRFAFTAEDEAFRQEVRGFYQKELPPGWYNAMEEEATGYPFVRSVRKKLAARGWLTMSWPREYGGQAAPVTRQLIFAEESARARFEVARDSGVGYLGPAIMHHGTEEQKQRFLGPISRAELDFHQGFSEPDAGSDLAGLKTRADRDGDYYVIKGQKVWGGHLRHATYSFLLARTDQNAPKHKGISLLVIPANTPGLKYEEFGNLGGGTQNLVYYDGCRVPISECLIGEENRGWYIATTVLNFERVVIEYAAAGQRYLEEVVEYWRSRGLHERNDGVTLALRHRLAEIAIEIEVCKMLAYRVGWVQMQGKIPTYESSTMKIFGSEMTQRFAHLATNVGGLFSEIARDGPESKYRPLRGRIENNVPMQIIYSIVGGANEIQRGLIASRGLGLPRE